MGVVRLAKCLKLLNSLDEYKDRRSDIRNKIQGERVYMDFVSIVYKIQQLVANELNYLLFSFYLSAYDLLSPNVVTSDKFFTLVNKFKHIIPNSGDLVEILTVLKSTLATSKNTDDAISNALSQIKNTVTKKSSDDFIKEFKEITRGENVISEYVYRSVVNFIVDLLTNKLANVEYVLIAFDGIPSFGKVQEQRQRRYMRYAFNEFQRLIRKDDPVPEAVTQPTNTIKSTVSDIRRIYDKDYFQVDIRSAIDYVYSKYHTLDLQKDISDDIEKIRQNDVVYLASNDKKQVVVEVVDKPYGEGEKILMDKLIQDYQTFKNDKSYVFYSPDGDSVILCLHIYIKTKVNNLTVVKTYNPDPTGRHNESSQYVNTKSLYNNIVNIVQKFTHTKIEAEDDKDRICSDFILMMNFFGNDFIHQIPTMEISSTFMDTMYIYSKFITENDYLTTVVKQKNRENITVNFASLINFIKTLSEFEHMMMLDTYMSETDDKQKIVRYFGEVFPCRYMLDYRDHITLIKKELFDKIKGSSMPVDDIKQLILDSVDKLNAILTVSNKKYGDIWMKLEIKNLQVYAEKVYSTPNILLSKYPRFVFHMRSKRKNDEHDLKEMIDKIEKDLLAKGLPIDLDKISSSNDESIKDFSFEYSNIRALTPHEQMPTTDDDINIYMLEWRSGRWMHVLNGYSFEMGYDWKKSATKKIELEMKRYQYDVLGLNNTQLNRMVIDYMRTFSWMIDYYMNTDYESTSTEISTWSFNYDRSPFLSHIAKYLNTITESDLKSIMKNFYTRSLVPTENYIKSDKHRFYIYPQSVAVLDKLPKEYGVYFPDMDKNIKTTVDMFKNMEGKPDSKIKKEDRFFDCRLCPYFSKCVFKAEHLTFKQLVALDLNGVLQYKILKRPSQKPADSSSINSSSVRPVTSGSANRHTGHKPYFRSFNRQKAINHPHIKIPGAVKNVYVGVTPQKITPTNTQDLTEQAFNRTSHIEI